MKRIYCLRKVNSEEIAVCVANNQHEAFYLAGGGKGHKLWKILDSCSVSGFSRDEKLHMDTWKKTAKKMFEEETK